jgi:hypothetical protein
MATGEGLGATRVQEHEVNVPLDGLQDVVPRLLRPKLLGKVVAAGTNLVGTNALGDPLAVRTRSHHARRGRRTERGRTRT